MKKIIYSLVFIGIIFCAYSSTLEANALVNLQINCGSNINGNPVTYENGKLVPCNGGTRVAANVGNVTYSPLEPIPGVTTDAIADFPSMIKAVFRIAFSIGSLLAVAMLVIGGIEYMVSDVVTLKAEGIRRARAAMWGMLLLAGSWLILNTINPNLLDFKLPGATATRDGAQTGGQTNTQGTKGPTQAQIDACEKLNRHYDTNYDVANGVTTWECKP